jgi:hypothetical protein
MPGYGRTTTLDSDRGDVRIDVFVCPKGAPGNACGLSFLALHVQRLQRVLALSACSAQVCSDVLVLQLLSTAHPAVLLSRIERQAVFVFLLLAGTYNVGGNTVGCTKCGTGLTTTSTGSTNSSACGESPSRQAQGRRSSVAVARNAMHSHGLSTCTSAQSRMLCVLQVLRYELLAGHQLLAFTIDVLHTRCTY